MSLEPEKQVRIIDIINDFFGGGLEDIIEEMPKLRAENERLQSENDKLRKALKAILNDVGYKNPMRMTTEISDKILEDAAGALNDKIL